MRDEPEFRDGFLSTAEGVSPFVCGWLSKRGWGSGGRGWHLNPLLPVNTE